MYSKRIWNRLKNIYCELFHFKLINKCLDLRKGVSALNCIFKQQLYIFNITLILFMFCNTIYYDFIVLYNDGQYDLTPGFGPSDSFNAKSVLKKNPWDRFLKIYSWLFYWLIINHSYKKYKCKSHNFSSWNKIFDIIQLNFLNSEQY